MKTGWTLERNSCMAGGVDGRMPDHFIFLKNVLCDFYSLSDIFKNADKDILKNNRQNAQTL